MEIQGKTFRMRVKVFSPLVPHHHGKGRSTQSFRPGLPFGDKEHVIPLSAISGRTRELAAPT
jgi:hypothetical protein